MIAWRGDDPPPTPEQLAAYADGELDGRPECAALRQHIEAWLAHHPEADAEVEAQRRLAQLWQASSPPEPSEAAWNDVLAQLEQHAATRPAAPARLGLFGKRALAAGVVAASAAAVWLTLAWLKPPAGGEVARQGPPRPEVRPQPVPPRPAPRDVEPFPVATADEVEILSIQGADTGTLVVGEPPVRGPLVLVAQGEVEVTRAEPEVRMGSAGPPMIWAPLANERDDP